MKDHYGRTIDHLRMSVTDRCGLRCLYCMPEGPGGHVARDQILSFEEIAAIAQRLVDRFGLRRVRITGGEPLVRPNLDRLVAQISRVGLEEIAITTNGQTLARSIDALAAAGLRRVNVSLDSLDPDCYRRMTGGELARTLEGIEAADRCGLRPIKINTVVIRNHNEEEVERLVLWALERGFQIRFLELMAIGCVRGSHPQIFVPTREVRDRLRELFAMEPVVGEIGAPARLWKIEANGLTGTIGFISPETEPFCDGCRRLRLTAMGKFLGCLMHEDGPDLRAILRAPEGLDEEAFDREVRAAVGAKPVERIRQSGGRMVAIGG